MPQVLTQTPHRALRSHSRQDTLQQRIVGPVMACDVAAATSAADTCTLHDWQVSPMPAGPPLAALEP